MAHGQVGRQLGALAMGQRTTSGWRRRCCCHWLLADLCRPCSEARAPRAMAVRSMVVVLLVNGWTASKLTVPCNNARGSMRSEHRKSSSAGISGFGASVPEASNHTSSLALSIHEYTSYDLYTYIYYYTQLHACYYMIVLMWA